MVCFQPPSLLIGKVWVPVMRFRVSHTLQSALESGQEARIVQIDFTAAFDRVNRQGILYEKPLKYTSLSIDSHTSLPLGPTRGGSDELEPYTADLRVDHYL